MVTVRSTAAALLFGLLGLGPFVPAARAATALHASVSGVTRDASGHALAGVEIFVLSEPGATAAVARAVSDDRGRFVLSALDPGVYRVAAVKTGYIAALSVVNTLLKSSVDLVLRPVPKAGEPGSERVADDLSWTLRLPPRSILRELDAGVKDDGEGKGGPRTLASRVPDSLRGQVDHVVALGSWQPAGRGPSTSLEGAETRMRLAGSLGERGSIQVAGRRGSFDSSTRREAPAVRRQAADVDVDVTYDTSDDGSLAMSAFYSKGDLELGGSLPTTGKGPARQGQRSWGYDATWKKQVDATSQVAVQVGYHDASLDLPGTAPVLDGVVRDASNRGIGAEGSYESFAGDGHVVRVGLRAQRMFLAAPDARLARTTGSFPLEGSDGWSVLMDAGDAWTLDAGWSLDYGLAVRQTFNGPSATYVTPRVGGSWTSSRLKASAEVSYLAANQSTDAAGFEPWRREISPVGYQIQLEAPLSATVSLRGTTAFVPLEAGRWTGGAVPGGVGTVYLSDGTASNRFVAFSIERSAANANVSLGLARGRARGALAPAFEDDLPIILLENRTILYEAVRLGTRSARSGSRVAFEYRTIREDGLGAGGPPPEGPLRTVELRFTQDLVRLGGGRATCRLIVTARTVVDPPASSGSSERDEARRFAAENRRIGAGVSLAF